MTNREKLNSECLYDLLCRMQKNGNDCVILQLTGEYQDKQCEDYRRGWVVQCRECIAAFLNERAAD
jgi:hypothetical protein